MTTELQERWYQSEAIESLFDCFERYSGTNPDGSSKKVNPLIALPTGTGKSVVIAKFIMRVFNQFPRTRVIMATHVKELIKQNFKKMRETWPLAPVGIFSAGLNQYDVAQPIIFGGIRSMVGKGHLFGHIDLLVIDEAHLVNDDGSYIQFIIELLNRNPRLKVIGLSATIYRMGLGLLTNGPIFNHVCYDLTNIDGFNSLIAGGFLCPLIPKRTDVVFDVSNVGMLKGDYNQKELEQAVDTKDINYAMLAEAWQYGQDRRSWIVFASGINHAKHLCDMLNSVFNIPSVVYHSKQNDTLNDEAMAAWKSGKVRCIVSMNGLTTGVDHPELDYCIMARPTMSTGLWVQMLGRLTRPFPGKVNGLVMDFAGNTKRLGPINDPVIPRFKGKGPPGDAPVRICPNCGVYNHARAVSCVACGFVFVTDTKLAKHASTMELLRSDLPQVENLVVQNVGYSKHIKRADGSVSLKASYYCGLQTFYEWILIEGKGYPLHQAREWIRQRWGEPWDGMTVDDVLGMSNQLRKPKEIRIWLNKKNPQVLGATF